MQSSKRLSLIISIAIFVMVSAISILFNYYNYSSQKQRLIEYISTEETNSFNSSKAALNNNAQTIFSTVVFKDDIYRNIADAYHGSSKVRSEKRHELLVKLYPTYQLLKTNNIRQLHFHLADGSSFLRFHRPEMFGDQLYERRYSISRVDQTHAPVEGFEEGTIVNGYRHVYPIIYKDEYVGSVEISFSIEAIFNSIIHDHKEFFGLLLHKSVIENKVLSEEQRKNYQPSSILKDFLVDKNIQSQTQSTLFENTTRSRKPITQDKLAELHAAVRKEVGEKFNYKCENYRFVAKLKDEEYLINFFPLKNIQRQLVGYIVNYQAQPGLQILYLNFIHNTVIIGTLLLIISVLMYFYLSNKITRHRQLNKMAKTDNLTGIFNRASFKDALKDNIKLSRQTQAPLSMIFFDIDFFKKINDNYGHLIGDKVLQKLATVVQDGLTHTDIFARWGGEEFVILLPDTDLYHAAKVAERLRKKLESLQGFDFNVTSSFGVSCLQPNDTADTFMHRVDGLLYQSKEQGRNRVTAKSTLTFED